MCPPVDRSLRASGTLSQQLSDNLRERIGRGEFAPLERLPSETALAAEYSVSRVTVRAALSTLQSQGLIDIRHGSGSFVARFGDEMRVGLQELRSISDTIRRMGATPSMQRRSLTRRRGSAAEQTTLGLGPGEAVLALERAVLADGQPVAFSYDVLPARLFSLERGERLGERSTFEDLAASGIDVVRASAELHAVVSADIGWGPGRPRNGLYLLLDQLHMDRHSMPVMHSRTYFVEGRFRFSVLRTS